MTDKELEVIRRRWEEYSEANPGPYRAFLFSAHEDMGKLLAEVDLLKSKACRKRGPRNKALAESALQCAKELLESGKKPHNICSIVAKKMGLKPGVTRNYLGAFVAELRSARDSA